MLRIIIAVLLCAILVYSTDNNLKALAVVCLLIQAYSDTRGKKEKFENRNNKQIKNIRQLKQIAEADIKTDQNKVNRMSEKVVDLIYQDNPEGCLSKTDFVNRVKSDNFINLLKKNALFFI